MKKLIPITLSTLMFLAFMPTETTSDASTTYDKEIEVEIVKLETPTVNEPQPEEKTPQYISLGEFLITAYCPCMQCCNKTDGITATGTKATQGRTIAVDPKVIPYGTTVMFDGNIYTAEDCGGAIKQNRIDLFFDSHQSALEWGKQYHEVFILVED